MGDRAQPGEEGIIALKNDSAVHPWSMDRAIRQGKPPCRRLQEARHQIEHGRLPASTWSEEAEELTLSESQGEVRQNRRCWHTPLGHILEAHVTRHEELCSHCQGRTLRHWHLPASGPIWCGLLHHRRAGG